MNGEDECQDGWRDRPPMPRKSRSSNSISASHASGMAGEVGGAPSVISSPASGTAGVVKKKKKSVSLNGTLNPEPDTVNSAPAIVVSDHQPVVGLERKKSKKKMMSPVSKSPTLREEDYEETRLASLSLDSSSSTGSPGSGDAESEKSKVLRGSRTFHGISAPSSSTGSSLTRRKSMDKIRETDEEKAERKLQRRLSRDSTPSVTSLLSLPSLTSSLPLTSPRRAEEAPSASPPVSPRDGRASADSAVGNMNSAHNVPAPLVIPRRRKDSIDKHAPLSPHPLRNSFTQDDIIVEPAGTAQNPAILEIRPLPKKNSLSGIQETAYEGDSPVAEEPMTTVAKLKLSGAILARRQSLPINRRRTPSLEKSDATQTTDLVAANRIRSQSLDIPGLVLPLSLHLPHSLNETREEKLDRLNRLLPFADRYSLGHFLDEVAGNVDDAVDLFLQKSMFFVGADGNIKRLTGESTAEDSSSESPSVSPVRRSRLSRMMGGISTNLSPTKSLRALFDRDKDKDRESRSLTGLFDKGDEAKSPKKDDQKEKRKSILDDTDSMNSHDRGIEDLLKLLETEEAKALGEAGSSGSLASSTPGSKSESPTTSTPPPKKTRPRNLSFSLAAKGVTQSMKRSSSTPFAPESNKPASTPANLATLKERRVFSSDSLPTAISRRVFLDNVPIVTPSQQRMNHSSDSHIGASLMKESNSISENLHKLIHARTTVNNRKRLFFAIETLTTECVYVQVLEVLACVFVKPLYQAIIDKQPIISLYEMQAIFSSLVDAPKHHLNFFMQLQQRLQTWNDKSIIGDIFVEHINKLAPYKTFVGNLSAAKNMVLRCMLSNPKFEEFLEDAMKDPLCNGTPLRELLDAPLQRIPRYKMLLRDLLGCTDPAHPDFQKLAAAYNNIKIMDEALLNLKVKEENLKRLSLALQSVQDCPPMLLACPRSFVDEVVVGELNSNGTTKRILKLILLSDALIIAPRQGTSSRKASSSSSPSPAPKGPQKLGAEDLPFKFESLVTLSSIFIMETPEKAPEGSFHLWISESAVVYQSQSEELRTRWLNNLRSVISRTPLQPETQNQLSRHLSQRSSSRLSFSLKRRSVSLTSSQSPTAKDRMSVTSFDSVLKPSSSKASLREEKLEDILRDPVGLDKFTQFLKGEFSDENIAFWEECEVYKQKQPGEFHDAALSIVETFIITGARSELNIKYKIRENLIERVARNEFDDTLFNEVQEDIFALMLTDSFPRFLKSEFYSDYCKERNQDRYL